MLLNGRFGIDGRFDKASFSQYVLLNVALTQVTTTGGQIGR